MRSWKWNTLEISYTAATKDTTWPNEEHLSFTQPKLARIETCILYSFICHTIMCLNYFLYIALHYIVCILSRMLVASRASPAGSMAVTVASCRRS